MKLRHFGPVKEYNLPPLGISNRYKREYNQ